MFENYMDWTISNQVLSEMIGKAQRPSKTINILIYKVLTNVTHYDIIYNENKCL